MTSHWADFAGALRRYSIEADLISTLPLSSSVNGLSREGHVLADILIGPVLAGGLDQDGVLAAGHAACHGRPCRPR